MAAAEPTITKTYTPLSQVPNAYIGKCGGVLPNHMQCWRAGDILIEITEVTPSEKKDGAPAVKVSTYQLCRAHAAAEKQQDQV